MNSYESELDEKFDNGENVLEYFDIARAQIQEPVNSTKKINLTIPQWLVDELDRQANHLAVSRNAIVNIWLAERAKSEVQA